MLFVSSIILGIGALVAINSLSDTLQEEIDRQAANLLGADLELSSGKPIPPSIRTLVDSLGHRRTEQRGFASMI